MNIGLLSAEKISLAEGALYAVIGFVIVLAVLALLVGIFYLSGFIFQSKLFNKQKVTKPVAPQPQSNDDETDEQLVAAITAAIACVLESESQDGEAPEFVIKRIVRKK
ncbi:MAG: OadG family protein [Clostridiales bacterium]|nr:OadG family protein [Clostridiales bacterium]